jgi:hypothetical protein
VALMGPLLAGGSGDFRTLNSGEESKEEGLRGVAVGTGGYAMIVDSGMLGGLAMRGTGGLK